MDCSASACCAWALGPRMGPRMDVIQCADSRDSGLVGKAEAGAITRSRRKREIRNWGYPLEDFVVAACASPTACCIMHKLKAPAFWARALSVTGLDAVQSPQKHSNQPQDQTGQLPSDEGHTMSRGLFRQRQNDAPEGGVWRNPYKN